MISADRLPPVPLKQSGTDHVLILPADSTLHSLLVTAGRSRRQADAGFAPLQSMQIDKPRNRSAPLAIIRRKMLTESEPATSNIKRTHP